MNALAPESDTQLPHGFHGSCVDSMEVVSISIEAWEASMDFHGSCGDFHGTVCQIMWVTRSLLSEKYVRSEKKQVRTIYI